MAARLSLLICLVGALLVVVSVAWPHLVGGRQAWSQEDAAEHSRAMVKLHGLTLQDAHDDARGKAAGDAELAAARKDFERGRESLDNAHSRGQTTASVFRWLGILAVLGGGAAYLMGRR